MPKSCAERIIIVSLQTNRFHAANIQTFFETTNKI